jgi:4-amino-4-deoxy-L-arabinose transferase-like glycosyltransferase
MSAVAHRRRGLESLLLGLGLALIYLPGLGSPEGSSHHDESFYLAISAEMDERGEWLTPTLDGQPTWNKPPLLYWAQILCYRALGRTLFAGRLPVALSAIALCFATGALARRLFGERAFLKAALMSATALGALRFGRLAMMDIPMSLALTLAELFAFRAAAEKRPALLCASGAFVGLACLLKGPVAAVVAFLALAPFLYLSGPRGREVLFSRWALAAVALALAVALPFYVASLAVHGKAFFEAFFLNENARRFGYWPLKKELELLLGYLIFLLPWLALAAGNLRWPRGDDALLLLLFWIGATLFTFTIPGHKYPHYGLACAPAAIALAAGREPPRWALRTTGALLSLVGLLALAIVRLSLPALPRAALVPAGLLLLAAGALAARGRISPAAGSAGAAAALAIAVVIPGARPPLLTDGARAALAGRPLFLYRDQPGRYRFAGLRLERLFDPAAVAAALDQGGAVILPAADWQRLPEEFRVSTTILQRWPRTTSVTLELAARAFRSGDPAALYEEVLAVERSH